MPHATGDWPVTPATGVTLTVRSSAWRYLEEWVDSETETIVLVWGSCGEPSELGWSVAILPRDELPTSQQTTPIELALGDYTLIVLQPQHVEKLDGRMLIHEAGQLIVA